MRPKALDLFCCAGGVSMGLHRAGFDVTGVDIKKRKRYPFEFIQSDAFDVDLRGYDFIWASPPCQGYTGLRHAPNTIGAPRWIAKVRRKLIKETSSMWCIENVEEARWDMNNPIMLCGSAFNLGTQGFRLQRHRLFECNFPIESPGCRHDDRPVVGVYGGHARNRSASAGGRSTKDEWIGGHKAAMSEAMGIDWMTTGELSEAIPPAYSEYIGREVMKRLGRNPE